MARQLQLLPGTNARGAGRRQQQLLPRLPVRASMLVAFIGAFAVFAFVLSLAHGGGRLQQQQQQASSPLDRLATYMSSIFVADDNADPDALLKQVDPAGFQPQSLPADSALLRPDSEQNEQQRGAEQQQPQQSSAPSDQQSPAQQQPAAAVAQQPPPSAVAVVAPPPPPSSPYWLTSDSLADENFAGEKPVHVVTAGGTVWLVAGWPVEGCEVPCFFDRDGSKGFPAQQADGVVFIGTRALSQPPDPRQVNIVFHSESDGLYPEQRRTYEMLGQGLDVCACYHLLNDTVIRAARERAERERQAFEMMTITYSSMPLPRWLETKPTPWEQLEETAPACLLVSNCGHTTSGRNEVIERLQKVIKIDSFGACMRNRDQPKVPCPPAPGFWDTKICIMRQYKFYLAFENSIDESYVTEKFWLTLFAGSVPVYLGAANINDLSPTLESGKPSFLQVRDFASVEELGHRLNFLANNRTEYEKYLEWRTQPFPPRFQKLIAAGLDLSHTACTLCKHVARVRRRKAAAAAANATRLS